MPVLPQIDDLAKRGALPSATFNPRNATGADFGGQIGDALQTAGSALQDLSGAVEQGELLRAADQKRLRQFQIETDFVEFQSAEQQALAEAQQGIESGGWEFQKSFVEGHAARSAEWAEKFGLTEEEQGAWSLRRAELQRGFSTSALQTELAERNRFYIERTTSSLDTLMTEIDRDPASIDSVLDRGQRIINETGLPESVKDTLSLRLQESAATAYGTALVDRDASAALAAMGGPVTEAGDFTGPSAGEAKSDFDFFRSQGLPSVAAAAVLGVLSWESGGGEAGINPNGRNPGDGSDGSDSIGAGQWNAERADALKAFAAERGKPWNDKGVQLQFVMHELKTSEPEAYRRLMTAQTVEQAVEAMNYYERPQGWRNGGDPTAVIHWNERVERAKHFAGAVATENAPPGEALDPHLQMMPYAARRSLIGAAERGIQAEIQATAQAQQAQHQERLNSLLVDLTDGKKGPEDVAEARASWLTDVNEITRANQIIQQRASANTALNTFQGLWASSDFQWNPYDSDQQKAVEAGFAADPSMANLQSIIDRTGMMPENAGSAIRGQLLSRDPAQVLQAATLASNAMARNPNVFTPLDGAEDIERAGTMLDYYVNTLGLPAEEAGQRLMADNDPQRPGRIRPDAEALRLFAKDTRDRFSAASIVARMPGGRGRSIARVQELAVLEDFQAIASENFRLYGDEGAARHVAQREINRLYGVTANGTFTKYPPENIYPAVNGSHDYLYDQAAERVQLTAGREVRPEDTFLMPLPTVTAEAWRRGEQPAYSLGYRYEVDGQQVYDILPGAWRFVVPANAEADNTDRNRERFERSQERRRNQRAVPGRSLPGMPGTGGRVF